MKLTDIISEGLIASAPHSFVKRKLKSLGFDTLLWFNDPTVNGPLSPQQVTKLSQALNQVGWYVALTYDADTEQPHTGLTWTDPRVYSDSGTRIVIEPRYDTPQLSLPETLYHVAPTTVREKIQKQGIVPRSKSRRAYHPERVYMATSMEHVNTLIQEFTKDNPSSQSYDVWALSRENAQNYKWHVDPSFPGDPGEPAGIFTYSAIPPSQLTLGKT